MQHANAAQKRWYSFPGLPVKNPDVLAVLEGCEDADDGCSAIVDGKKFALTDIQYWKEMHGRLDRDFGRWCREAALCPDLEEMNSYFGCAACALDFRKQKILWPELFAAQAAAGPCEPQPIDVIESILLFEEDSGLAHLVNPRLLPRRDKLRDMVGGFDAFYMVASTGRHSASSPQERAHDEEVATFQGLNELWGSKDHEREREAILDDMKEAAVESYVAGRYDPDLVFEKHCARLRRWACAAGGLEPGEELGRIAARLALLSMCQNEYLLVSSIAKLVARREPDPQPLDRSRLEKLRAGTTSLPKM